MRVLTETTKLQTAPGGAVQVNLDVVNTTSVIDGVTARVIGLDPQQVAAQPPLLPLFPDATGRMSLTMDVPVTFPAGRHPLTIELTSSVPGEQQELVDVDLVVEPRPHLAMSVKPAVQRAYRRGRFHVECRNNGNVPLTTTLAAFDQDRVVRCDLSEHVLTIEPGASASTMLTLRAKRRLFGSDFSRVVTVTGETDLDVEDDAAATLRQRPLIARGMLTALILAFILAAWAGAFLLGMTKVFASDPLTKTAPASFFVSAKGDNGLRAAVTPGDVLSKTSALPPGVGGGVAGTVTAASTGSGIGRIVVEALRPSQHGLVLEASAATQADGSYALLGLLPGSYYLRFSAIGYRTAWYPSANSQAKAKLISASAQTVARNINTNIVGLPATISGSVDPGDTTKIVHTVVTARALQGPASSTPLAKVTTDKNGNYTLRNLPAPGTYELGYVAAGYAPTTVIENVTGGQARSEPTVRLSAGAGSIDGIVTSDGKTALGGVTVTTSQAGQQYTTTTPTLGQVGHFAFTGLPTPGTYVLTFTKQGFGARTIVVGLAPGEHHSVTGVQLASGTGTVTGHVTDNTGTPLGNVTVTVGGTSTPVQTTTLTDGDPGAYALSGLPAPGTYTLTFTAPGFSPQTLPVSLTADAPKGTADAALTSSVGAVSGRVVDDSGNPLIGATVVATDGSTSHKTVTVAQSGATAAGGYRLTQLAPGPYSITVTAAGQQQETALVTVLPGVTQCQNFRLAAPGGSVQEPPACG